MHAPTHGNNVPENEIIFHIHACVWNMEASNVLAWPRFSVEGMFPGVNMDDPYHKFDPSFRGGYLIEKFETFKYSWQRLNNDNGYTTGTLYSRLLCMFSMTDEAEQHAEFESIKGYAKSNNVTDELVHFAMCMIDQPDYGIEALNWWSENNACLDRDALKTIYFKFLIRGCRSGNLALVEYLLDHFETNVNGGDSQLGALWYIYSLGFDDTTEENRKEISLARFNIYQVLLLRGADPGQKRYPDSMTPMSNVMNIGEYKTLDLIFSMYPRYASEHIMVQDCKVYPLTLACLSREPLFIKTVIKYTGTLPENLWMEIENLNIEAVSVMIKMCNNVEVVARYLLFCFVNYYIDIMGVIMSSTPMLEDVIYQLRENYGGKYGKIVSFIEIICNAYLIRFPDKASATLRSNLENLTSPF